MSDMRSFRRLSLSLLVACAAAGCGKKMIISQVPPFWDESLKTIAVVPFRSHMDGGVAGRMIADELAACLQANGTYHVYNRNDLQTLMNEHDLQMALSDDPAVAAQGLKKLGKVQALLVGNVADYRGDTQRQRKQDPVYGYTAEGAMYVSGYRTYDYITNSAVVSASATLIRVDDGSTIHATPAWNSRPNSQGENPRYSPADCLNIARNNVVASLLAEFAITRQEITIDPAKAFRTATEMYDNKWYYSERFKPTCEKMFVVVALPANCDRNRFNVTIIREGERQVLAEQPLVWSRNNSDKGHGLEFCPRDIAAKGGGNGAYVAKFYSGPEPIMEHKFTIAP